MVLSKDYNVNRLWSWRTASPFSHTVEVNDQIFISGQPSLDAAGIILAPDDIANQTRHVFENMKAALLRHGLGLENLVRLNTYYVFDGTDEDATEYWESMTRVRLEYFPDPGPAATAVRIKGMPYKGQLIQIEGIAVKGASFEKRKRIMPSGSWDWSIPVPLTQGWECFDSIYVGGQISADKLGVAVHEGDIVLQTQAIYNFIDKVVKDSGGSFKDIAHLKICVKHNSKDSSGVPFLTKIIEVTKERFGANCPVITCFGVDLLYPGLVLEIDAMAFKSKHERITMNPTLGSAYDVNFADVISASGETWVGGQEPLDNRGNLLCEGDNAGQARVVFGKLQKLLNEKGLDAQDIVKLNLFFVSEKDDISEEFHSALDIWQKFAPNSNPAMTAVRVYELSSPGVSIQADCIAIKR
jgi:enamine deaminase RidA (YjgF/YER057c/UK114 family)